jgi:hypothetical protein
MPVPASEIDFDHTVLVPPGPHVPMQWWTCVNAQGPDGLPIQCRIEFRTPDCCVGVVVFTQSEQIQLGQKIRFLIQE